MKKSKYLISKIGLIVLLLLATIGLTSCSNDDSGSKVKEEGKLLIGINQLMEHPALDDAREGFLDRLEELGIDAEIIYKNAQGDLPNSLSIAQKFVKDDVDLIYAIGTPAAQSTKQATSDIPILFSAVTDPVESGLVEDWDIVGGNITGTSDMAVIEDQLKLFNELDPTIETIGIIYNTSESNSSIQIKQVKEIAPKLNLKIETTGINNISEVAQATDHLLSKVDAVYILSDNMIASSIGLVSEKLVQSKMLSISAEESQVAGGILMTNGLSYYELGRQTGDMLEEILIKNKNISEMAVGLSKVNNTVVNEKTLKALNLDENNPIFKDAVLVGN